MAFAVSLLLLFSCTEDGIALIGPYNVSPGAGQRRREGSDDFRYSDVLILYSEGYNNLKTSLDRNIETICGGYVPAYSSRKGLVVFSHSSKTNSDYSTPVSPVVFRIFKSNGQVVKDTLFRYPAGSVSVNAEFMRGVLADIRKAMPSSSYGMLYSSHGTGWLPKSYTDFEKGYSFLWNRRSLESIGAQYDGSSSRAYQLDIGELSSALPYKLDYLVADVCLMGGAEVIYEWRNLFDYIVASPGEVLAQGFDYEHIVSRLLEGAQADLEGVCEDYYQLYANGSSAVIALYDCDYAKALADEVKALVTAHPDAFSSLDPSEVQDFNFSFDYHFDLRDIFVKAGLGEEELAPLDAVLSSLIKYKAATSSFLGTRIDTYCGLSMFIPSQTSWPNLSALYKETAWSIYTGYGQY